MDTPKVRKRAPRKGEGRPTIFTQELADKICEQVSNGWSMRTICSAEDMPAISSVFKWLRENEQFSLQYARATDERTETQQEMLIEMGDRAIEHAEEADPKAAGAVVSAYKLKADNLKWSMSKMKPKKYGDKLDVTSGGEKLPTPILNAVPNNIGTTQDTESK